jgi:hypothetical protein
LVIDLDSNTANHQDCQRQNDGQGAILKTKGQASDKNSAEPI